MDNRIAVCKGTAKSQLGAAPSKTTATNTLPVKLFTFMFIFTVIGLSGLGWYMCDTYRHFKDVATKQFRMIELTGIITHFEEILTMSARMAAATGDLGWENRHKSFAPQLDAAIKEIAKLAPRDSMSRALMQTNIANVKLVTMEKKALEMVHRGNRKDAADLLYSQDHEKQKQIYSESMTKFTAAMPEYVKTELNRYRQHTLAMITLIAVIVPMAVYVWVGMLNVLRRYIVEKKHAAETLEILNAELADTVKKLSVANHELQDFVRIMAHDLKAPLRAIGTLAGWISIDYGDRLDEHGKERLTLLIKRAVRMSEYIDRLLLYLQIGHFAREKQLVNLNSLVTKLINKITPPKNIQITIENELPAIASEDTAMTQLFESILSNAVKYMDKPQGIIKVGCVEENGFWKFSVSDNGPGIEKKYFEKIFQLFQTLSSRDESESTGIGLAVAKKIVEMYEGRIWVESEPGSGTTFFFTLPVSNLKPATIPLMTEEKIA